MTEKHTPPGRRPLGDRLQEAAALVLRLDPESAALPEKALLSLVEMESDMRRKRAALFPTDMVANTAWDIFIELARVRLKKERKPLAEICASLGVAFASGVREISRMIEGGLVSRDADGRRLVVHLTDKGLAMLAASYCAG